MNLNIRISGPAWAWVNSTVDIIASLFAELGYDLVTDIEYESRIKWGVNFFDVNISDEGKKYLTKYVDIILAFNAESLYAQLSSLKPGSTIIINKKWLSKLSEKGVSLEDYNILSLDIQDKYDNTYLLGILAKYLNLDLDIMLDKLAHVFAKKWEEIIKYNQDIVKVVYTSPPAPLLRGEGSSSNFQIKRVGPAKTMIYWNKAIADGATDTWLEFYSAYPMTPASTILTEIIKAGKVKYLQAEDEIAVINSAIWAAFTWARGMSGTSGGWFALMTEALSFAVQAEFPITVVLAQRAWPSTGTPTYHEAWDLNFALNPTFGDFEHVVMYPSSLEESYYFWWLALNIADKYQTQVILLTDKQAAELHWTHGQLKAPAIDRGVMLENPSEDYKRYEITESWVSPRVKVGTPNGDFISTSYEHDEYGATTEDSSMKKAMTEKRWRKLQNFFEKEGYRWYEVVNPTAKKMLVVTSFTSYTAREFIKENPEFGLIIVKFLKPLDERLREELVGKEEVIFVESNYSGQLEKYLTNELGLKYIDGLKISNLRKYDLFPFYIEDFRELIK